MIPTVFTFHREPKVTLVGAGPGDPELITLKAINAIKKADVVLFDALVSKEILELIPTGIPSFSVGKRAGMHSYTQEQINELIVELAYLYGHVIRLKGGDPFVFGRGMEEISHAEIHGLKTEVISGISSSIAVPASFNIPVTARGISESFWVVTATTKSGTLSTDLALAVQSSATIIILMGMKKLEEIVELFKSVGKADTPIAVIQNGTLASQRSVVGTVSNIVSLTRNEDLESPGIIVAGEVVRFARNASDVVPAELLRNYE